MAVETSLEAKAQEVAPQSEHGDIAQKTRDDSGKFLPSESRVDNMNSGKTKGGTSQDYLLGRIKRDHPELIPKIGETKEFKSARAAAIHCGIVRKRPRVDVTTPERMAKEIKELLDPEELKALMAFLLQWIKRTDASTGRNQRLKAVPAKL